MSSEEVFVMSCQLVSIVIVAYDITLTFSREVDSIWRRKISLVTVLFVLQRYCTLLEMSLNLLNPTQLLVCEAVAVILDILDILGMFGIALFSTIRVWAITGQSKSQTLVVFLFSMFVPAINIYNYSRPKTYSVLGGSCSVTFVSASTPAFLPILTRAIAIASDLLVLLITWMKTADVWRTSFKVKDFKPQLSVLLIRDGTLYFLSLLALNLITLLLDVFALDSVSGSTAFIYINEALAANLIARFILDLRAVFPSSNGTDNHGISNIVFSPQSIMGNMAAPLGTDSTWVTGPREDVESEQGSFYQESEEPFLVGLDTRDLDGVVDRTSESSSEKLSSWGSADIAVATVPAPSVV